MRGYSSSLTMMSPLRALMVTGTISSLNLPAFFAASALFWECDRKLVLLGARDLIFPGDILGGGAHVIAVEGIPQAVADHGVDELQIAHLLTGAQIRGMGGEAHGFLTARHHDAAVALRDRLGAQRHGAKARAADHVDAPGGAVDGNAGGDGCLARGVLSLRRGQHLAENDFGDLLTRDLGALQGRLDGDLAQLVGRRVVAKAPLKDPTGVRAADTMTTSSMGISFVGLGLRDGGQQDGGPVSRSYAVNRSDQVSIGQSTKSRQSAYRKWTG